MDIFGATATAIHITKQLIKDAEKAVKAQETVENLLGALNHSKELLDQANKLYHSLSTSDTHSQLLQQTDSLIDKTEAGYISVLDLLQGYLVNKQQPRTSFRHVIRRSKEGIKWAMNEKWILGRIEEIHEQDNRIRNTVHLLTAIKILDGEKAREETARALLAIKNGTDVSRFIEVIKQLPTNEMEPGRSPQDILRKARNTQPEWILEEEAFKAWIDGTEGLARPWLWVLGEAGSGKSTIATFIANYLSDLDTGSSSFSSDRLSSNTTSAMSNEDGSERLAITATTIYYCKYDAKTTQNAEHIFRTTLRQLMVCLWEAAPRDAYGHVKLLEGLVELQDTFGEKENVQAVLADVLESFDRVHMVIDGLDELPASELRDVIQSIRALRSPGVKLIVTSRGGLRAHAESVKAQIVDTNNNQQAITSYVQDRLVRIANMDESEEYLGPSVFPQRLETDHDRNEIADKIINLASGSFLCAEMQISQLINTYESEALDRALDNLCGTLDELIQKAMHRIENQADHRKSLIGKQAMMWAIFSRGSSLGLAELQHALAFNFNQDSSNTAEFSRQKLAEATCYFLSIGRDSDSVSIHKAVKDLCTKDNKGASYFGGAHAFMAKTCLYCLSKSRQDVHCWSDWEEMTASPFMVYAATNWGWHMAKARELLPQEPFPEIKVVELLRRDRVLDTITVAIQPSLQELGVWKNEMWAGLEEKDPPISLLHVLAFFNLPKTVGKLVSGRCDVDATGDLADHTALYLSSILGHEEVVRELMRLGADPLRRNGSGKMTALRGAILSGAGDVVDTILQCASKEEVEEMLAQRSRAGLLSLADACGNINKRGSLDIVKRILKFMRPMPRRHKMLLNLGGPLKQSALHRAMESDSADIVDELLNYPGGRDLLELRSKRGETPLLRAAWASWKISCSALGRLIEANADCSARDKHGCTAAHIVALHEGHVDTEKSDCFEVLLPKSDLALTNHDGETVLHVACKHGRSKHVALILSSLGQKRELLFMTDNKGRTPIMTAAKRHRGKDMDSRKSFEEHEKCLRQLISSMGNELSDEDIGHLLQVLPQSNQHTAFSLLLHESPAAKSQFENSSSTPIRQAVLTGHKKIVKAVLNIYGRDDLNRIGPEGQAPVVEAANLGFDDVAKYLLDEGADIATPGLAESTTIDWCARLCNAEVTEAVWAREPSRLMPEHARDAIKAMSARNPLRKLWQEKGLVEATDNHEVECLSSKRQGTSVAAGDGRTDRLIRTAELQDVDILGVQKKPYLVSEPLSDTIKVPLSRIHISISGKDQGWSKWAIDHPHDEGTFRGTDTWFEVAIERDGEIFKRSEITRNLLNAGDWTTYHTIWDVDSGPLDAPETKGHCRYLRPKEAQSFVRSLRPGDRICVIPRARGDGWECWINEASVKAYYED